MPAEEYPADWGLEHPPNNERPGPWFDARFPGECSRCGIEFVKGERIRADGEGGYECCGDHEEIEVIRDGEGGVSRKLRSVICERCSITKPCFCE